MTTQVATASLAAFRLESIFENWSVSQSDNAERRTDRIMHATRTCLYNGDTAVLYKDISQVPDIVHHLSLFELKNTGQ